MKMLTYLLIFPALALFWLWLNHRLGWVRDEPPISDDPTPDEPAIGPVRAENSRGWARGRAVRSPHL